MSNAGPRRARGLSALALVIASAACSKELDPAAAIRESSPRASDTLRANAPGASVQLWSGFHQAEGDGWRWTERRFSVVLAAPEAGPVDLWLEAYVPQSSIDRLGPLLLRGTLAGWALPPLQIGQGGELRGTWVVPRCALARIVRVDFVLDKALPAEEGGRELGLVLRAVGLSRR